MHPLLPRVFVCMFEHASDLLVSERVSLLQEREGVSETRTKVRDNEDPETSRQTRTEQRKTSFPPSHSVRVSELILLPPCLQPQSRTRVRGSVWVRE